MLAGGVRELRSHYFSHSWSSYIQKWPLELQDQEIGPGPREKRRGWLAVLELGGRVHSLSLRVGVGTGVGAGFPLPALDTQLPSSLHPPGGQAMGHLWRENGSAVPGFRTPGLCTGCQVGPPSGQLPGPLSAL